MYHNQRKETPLEAGLAFIGMIVCIVLVWFIGFMLS